VQIKLKDELLPAKDINGLNTRGYASCKGEKETVETLWCWVREVQLNIEMTCC